MRKHARSKCVLKTIVPLLRVGFCKKVRKFYYFNTVKSGLINN